MYVITYKGKPFGDPQDVFITARTKTGTIKRYVKHTGIDWSNRLPYVGVAKATLPLSTLTSEEQKDLSLAMSNYISTLVKINSPRRPDHAKLTERINSLRVLNHLMQTSTIHLEKHHV